MLTNKPKLFASLLLLFIFGCNACGDTPLPKQYVSLNEQPQPKRATIKTANWRDNNNYPCKFNKKVKIEEGQKAKVFRVPDGDTVYACLLPEGKDMVKIRTLGIDCPEATYNSKCLRDGESGRLGCKEQIPLGQKAKRVAKDLMMNEIVGLESHYGDGKFKRDRYHRTLAYLRLKDGRDYNKYTIEQKLCAEYSYRFKHPRQREYKKARHPDAPFK